MTPLVILKTGSKPARLAGEAGDYGDWIHRTTGWPAAPAEVVAVPLGEALPPPSHIRQFEPKLMEEGIGFDGSSVGLKSVKAGDMVLVPDLSTAFMDPFWESPTMSFICRTMEADTHEIFANDPRNIAIRAEEYMRSTGIADESRWGPEFEFYIFDSVSFENGDNRSGYTIESREADWNSHDGGHGHYIPMHGGYHAIPPKDQLYKIRTRMTQHMENMGVPVKYHH